MTNTAIYVRVSSARQVEEGFSLDEQEARCRAFVKSKGWLVEDRHVYIEKGVSGGKSSRPALDRMRVAAEAGQFAKLVGGDMDRIGRSASDTLDLLDTLDGLGIEPLDPTGRSFAASDPGSKMTRGVIALAAQYERDMISERARRAAPGKRARGSYNGGRRAFGYDFSPAGLVVNDREAIVVRRLFAEFNAGRTAADTARDLNAEGVVGPEGAKWSPNRITDRLDLALYAGFVGPDEVGRHTPIIDATTWARTRALRSASAQRHGRAIGGRRANVHLLGGGLLRCECGATMFPRRDSRGARDTYRCRGRDGIRGLETDCTMMPLPRVEVDTAVRAYIADSVLSAGMAEGELEGATKAAAKTAKAAGAAAQRDVVKAESKLRNGRERMLEDVPPFTPAEWSALKAELQSDLTEARARAAESERVAAALKRPSADLKAAVEAIRAAATAEAKDAEGVGAQRAAIERIFSHFDVVTGPASAPPAAELTADVAALVAEQDAAIDAQFTDTPEFTVKGRRVMLVPIPRPEVALRFGATPLDSLSALHPRDASGTP